MGRFRRRVNDEVVRKAKDMATDNTLEQIVGIAERRYAVHRRRLWYVRGSVAFMCASAYLLVQYGHEFSQTFPSFFLVMLLSCFMPALIVLSFVTADLDEDLIIVIAFELKRRGVIT